MGFLKVGKIKPSKNIEVITLDKRYRTMKNVGERYRGVQKYFLKKSSKL